MEAYLELTVKKLTGRCAIFIEKNYDVIKDVTLLIYSNILYTCLIDYRCHECVYEITFLFHPLKVSFLHFTMLSPPHYQLLVNLFIWGSGTVSLRKKKNRYLCLKF